RGDRRLLPAADRARDRAARPAPAGDHPPGTARARPLRRAPPPLEQEGGSCLSWAVQAGRRGGGRPGCRRRGRRWTTDGTTGTAAPGRAGSMTTPLPGHQKGAQPMTDAAADVAATYFDAWKRRDFARLRAAGTIWSACAGVCGGGG